MLDVDGGIDGQAQQVAHRGSAVPRGSLLKRAGRSTCHWKRGTKPLFRISSSGSAPDVYS